MNTLKRLLVYNKRVFSTSGVPKIVLDKRKRLYKRESNNFPGKGVKLFNTEKQEADTVLKIEDLLRIYAEKKEERMNLVELMESDRNLDEETILRSSVRLHQELPIRLAKRALELSSLPHDLSSMSSIKEIRNLYVHSFEEIISFSVPNSISLERRFTNHVKEIYERHSGVLWSIARGVYQLKQSRNDQKLVRFSLPETFPGLQSFLDHFFLSRLDIRILIGQHIALHEHIDGWIGLFCLKTSPFEITNSAARAARSAALKRYDRVPEIRIHQEEDAEQTFPFIPSFLHHILFELLKNSLKATIENPKSPTAPIKVVIAKDRIDVVDQGKGFESKEEIERAWSYMYTTATEEDCKELFEELQLSRGRDFDANELGLPIAGLGFGLPISRIFAEYLGGSLTIDNYGRGTKATLSLNMKSSHI